MELILADPGAKNISTVLGITDKREKEFHDIIMTEFDREFVNNNPMCAGNILVQVLKHVDEHNEKEKLFCAYMVGAKFIADKICQDMMSQPPNNKN